ncbi:MAG TPA: helix-turn-helix domain-containing protein [Rhizomicrobium sp.]
MNDDDDEDYVRAAAARKGSPFLNTKQSGFFLGLSDRTMEKMRRRGKGPKFRKHSRRSIRYHIADLEDWSASRAQDEPTDPPSGDPSPDTSDDTSRS